MNIFLAGIMQGSHRGVALHDQHYRGRIKELIRQYLPTAEVYDPLTDHADSIEYGDEKGRDVFMNHNRMCGEVDVVVAFVPEASMGTAVEMWEAHRHGRAVVTISPLAKNWAVKFLSSVIYATESEFETEIRDGRFAERLSQLGIVE